MSEYQLAKKAAVIGGSSWLYLGDVRDRAHPVWLGTVRTSASPGGRSISTGASSSLAVTPGCSNYAKSHDVMLYFSSIL